MQNPNAWPLAHLQPSPDIQIGITMRPKRRQPVPPPVALSMDLWIKGAAVAASAACSARLGPVATPTPSMAVPALDMIAFTSAKSTLMRPGTVMMSEIPCVGWREAVHRFLEGGCLQSGNEDADCCRQSAAARYNCPIRGQD